MVESDQILKDIREIKWHQESIDGSMELLIKANRDAILPEIMKFFGRSRRRAEIFLAVNGKRAVREIAEILGMKESNVSRELAKLKREGLIEIKRITSEGYYIYCKGRVNRILRISQKLKEKFEVHQF